MVDQLTLASFPDRHFCKIQDKDEDWYRQFQLIICGLDSIDARRWINSTLAGMVSITISLLVVLFSYPFAHIQVEFDDDGKPDELTIIPMIDGGTEGKYAQMSAVNLNWFSHRSFSLRLPWSGACYHSPKDGVFRVRYRCVPAPEDLSSLHSGTSLEEKRDTFPSL